MSRRTVRELPAAATRPKGSVALRSYPNAQPDVPSPALLQIPVATQTQPQRAFRQRFGRSISLDSIETALRAAYLGGMRDITDLSRETIDTDPHLAAVLNKRFRAVAGLPWDIVPATGPGINPDRAQAYADVAREQLRAMEGFRRMLLQQAWALFDGRACNELQWVDVAGQDTGFGRVTMAIAAAGWIHPRRLSFGAERELQIVDEAFLNIGGNFTSNGLDVRTIPYKFVWWLPQLFAEYPEREGLAQRCLYWSFFKRFGARERMILLELFGKPWRILSVEEDSSAQDKDLEAADAVIDSLGGSFTARLPRGTTLDIVQPQRSAGQVHQEVITESDRQISKLVLGQTGTTDGVPSGLNNQQANVMQDEQLMILHADSDMLGENIESRVTDAIIVVNFGPEAVTHAPHFVLRSDKPADRNTEIKRLDGSLKAGLVISRAEAYEISGFRQPMDDEPTIQMDQPPTPPNSPVAPAPRPIVTYPAGTSPPVSEQLPAPTQAGADAGATTAPQAQVGAADAAKTIKMNEDRASRGLPPMTLPDGSLDPDGELTIEEYNAKHLATHGPPPTDAQPAASAPDAEPTTELGGALNIAAQRLLARGRAESDPTATHNAGVLLRIMQAPSAEVVADPFAGEGGIHMHGIDRTNLTTALDGEHQHVFRLPDGRLMMTEFDGTHLHEIASQDADDIGTGGEHMHAIPVDGITGQTGFERSAHGHILQVFETGLDGPHTHTLPIRNPITGLDEVITSLTPGQFAALLAEMSAVQIVDPPAPVTSPIAQPSQHVDSGTASPVQQMPMKVSRSRARARRTAATAPPPGDRDDGEKHPRRRFFATRAAATARPTDPRDIAAQALTMLDRRVDRDVALALTESVYDDEVARLQMDRWMHTGCTHSVACAADQKQPDATFGNVETLLGESLKGATRAVAKLAAAYRKKVKGETTAAGIHAALQDARRTISINELATSIERRMIQAMAMGALDSAAETALDDPSIGEERIEDVIERGEEIGDTVAALASRQYRLATGDDPPDVSKMRFPQALKFFRDKNVITRIEFDNLSALAKQRAFTVAGILNTDMLATIQAELAKQIGAGSDLRDFQKFIATRLKDAGFLASVEGGALSASHVETVYRTNTLNAYNAGRATEMTAVRSSRPVWEIRVVRDGGTRTTHRRVHNKRLRADDAFWLIAYPPFGFNCRCRVISRGPKFLDSVVEGSTIRGLPDRGFNSGTPNLLR